MKKIIVLAVAFLIASPNLFAQLKAGRVGDLSPRTVLYTCNTLPNVTIYSQGKYNPKICGYCGMVQSLSQKELMKAQVTNPHGCPMSSYIVKNQGGQNLSLKEKMKLEVIKAANVLSAGNEFVIR